jgi:hyaluronan synthase
MPHSSAGVAAGADGFVPEPPRDMVDWALRIAIAGGLGALIALSWGGGVFSPLLHALAHHPLGALALRPTVLWVSMGSLLLAFRTVLWFRYRPFPGVDAATAPRLSVIIPAYNEGPMVAHAIDSVANAAYPRDRLEIIVVDDGSTDDTWLHIERAQRHHGARVTALRLDRNRGKREALAAGFRCGRGEIFVTLDSDSVIERGALLALAGPFSDPRVGAVAGRVLVLNRREGVIPRMLHVRFLLAFDFLRAYQSTFGTVYCTPGALSAYRASAVREVLPRWLGQRFLNVPATYGEDRALTNEILALGHDSVYQRTASVSTIVPTSYGKLCRMFLRWDRSYIREELRFARVVWKRPLPALLFALVDTTITNFRYPVAYATLGLLGAAVLQDPATLLRVLVAIGAMSLLYGLYYLRSERSFDLVYSVLYGYFAFFALSWIFPYAALTVRARGWLTR